MKEIDKVLKEARDLYNKGEWNKAREILIQLLAQNLRKRQENKTIEMLLKLLAQNLRKRQLSEINRLLGWISYYLGKKNKEDPEDAGRCSLEYFQKVIDLGVSSEDIDSARAGIPLVYFYLLKETDKAIETAKEAVGKANDLTARTAALDTLGCIQRDTGMTEEALKTFEEGIKLAIEIDVFRICAHILSNKAVIWEKLIPHAEWEKTGDALKQEAIDTLKHALFLYNKVENETGESTRFHREEIERKLEELKKL